MTNSEDEFLHNSEFFDENFACVTFQNRKLIYTLDESVQFQ